MCTLLNNAQIKEFVDSQVYMCKAHDLGSATLHKIFLFSDKAHVNTSPSWTNLLLVPKFYANNTLPKCPAIKDI